jgi:hypothetical protein
MIPDILRLHPLSPPESAGLDGTAWLLRLIEQHFGQQPEAGASESRDHAPHSDTLKAGRGAREHQQTVTELLDHALSGDVRKFTHHTRSSWRERTSNTTDFFIGTSTYSRA